MKNGQARFEYFLSQLQLLLDKAEKQRNPALWLYRNNARTPIFMLEGLAKLYAGIHNKKKFLKIKEHFKILEDMLGGVDYYDAFAKEFAVNKKIPKTITSYLQAQTREKIQSLNEALKEHGWLGSENKRMNKIRKKLKKAGWESPQDEVKDMVGFYNEAISGIITFTEKTGYQFSNVESDVHELRRKLRWLSIYPQALRGCVQLGKTPKPPKYLQKYLTPEIINSPYNKMPDAGDTEQFLLLDQNNFYALSWMIAELGKLKDSGLRVVAMKEALMQSSKVDEAGALRKAYTIAGKNQPSLQQILDNAETLCKTYFKEQSLQKLVLGSAATVS